MENARENIENARENLMGNRAAGRSPALAGTFGECIAEFFGTFVLLLFGDGSVATFLLFTNIGPGNAPTPFAYNWVVVGLGWGLAVTFGIYVAGAISGAHINPAVTVALAARGKFPLAKVIPYIVAQVIGAFLAAAVVYLVYRGAINHTVSLAGPGSTVTGTVGIVFFTVPKAFVGTFGAFCDEFVGTALLVGLIFAVTDARNQPVQGNLNPLIIGFIVVAIGLSFGLNTGYAINPARDFGPRLWIAIVDGGRSLNSYTWIPIVAPLLGGIAGGFIYDFTMGKVIEAKKLRPSGSTITRGEAVRERPGE
jgi:glycerol uptake facilitator protein